MNQGVDKGLAILGYGFICAAGRETGDFFEAFRKNRAPFSDMEGITVFPVKDSLISDHAAASGADRAVKLAMTAAEPCIAAAERHGRGKVLINVGSSRGATATWEREFSSFDREGKVSVKASPYTTPGNISSFIASMLKERAINLDHSVTCGSGLQAIANAYAWIKSGMCELAIAGGTEAPLTPFTLAQMKTLKIVSKNTDPFPTRPLTSEEARTGMLLGEGAALFTLGPADMHKDSALALISGLGTGHEYPHSPSGISSHGSALVQSMREAVNRAGVKPDLIMAHAPGTKNGDEAERKAIQEVFGKEMPRVFTNKHIIGHTLGASGTLSLITALSILERQEIPELPYAGWGRDTRPPSIRHILINATGFGGNAVSVMVSKNNG
jgi:3-oxoacyl-(acyl-carrier-protein) synthase